MNIDRAGRPHVRVNVDIEPAGCGALPVCVPSRHAGLLVRVPTSPSACTTAPSHSGVPCADVVPPPTSHALHAKAPAHAAPPSQNCIPVRTLLPVPASQRHRPARRLYDTRSILPHAHPRPQRKRAFPCTSSSLEQCVTPPLHPDVRMDRLQVSVQTGSLPASSPLGAPCTPTPTMLPTPSHLPRVPSNSRRVLSLGHHGTPFPSRLAPYAPCSPPEPSTRRALHPSSRNLSIHLSEARSRAVFDGSPPSMLNQVRLFIDQTMTYPTNRA